jgi:ABC-type polysaccharide/polyol phosphate transport system ATPase subunit
MIQLTHIRVTEPNGGTFKMLRGALRRERYARERIPVLHDFTLWLGRGESWALLGDDGAGKTTLLRVIAGESEPDSGTRAVHGRVTAAIGAGALQIQESGAQNVRSACHEKGMNVEETAAVVSAAHAFSGLGEQFFVPVKGYTSAQRAQLLLSLALCLKPAVLVIAETLDFCDTLFRKKCEGEIRRLMKGGTTLLLESRDAALQRRLCESAMWLNAGRLHRLGPFETVYAAYAFPRAQKAYTDVKTLLSRDKAAFSKEFAPETGGFSQITDWPEEARRALREAQALSERLNVQLTAYAEANLAFERENERLSAEAALYETRAKDSERMLARLTAVFTDMLQVMHAQFLHLRQLGAGKARKK